MFSSSIFVGVNVELNLGPETTITQPKWNNIFLMKMTEKPQGTLKQARHYLKENTISLEFSISI